MTLAEHAKQGVRCIAFHPGGIAETGMGQTAPEQFRSYLYDTGMVSLLPLNVSLPTSLPSPACVFPISAYSRPPFSESRSRNRAISVHAARRLPRWPFRFLELGHGAGRRLEGPDCERRSTNFANSLGRSAEQRGRAAARSQADVDPLRNGYDEGA